MDVKDSNGNLLAESDSVTRKTLKYAARRRRSGAMVLKTKFLKIA